VRDWLHEYWNARPGSRAGFAREALAERSSAANRRPSAWECDGGPVTAQVFASGAEIGAFKGR
jgi:hypothetical protein